MPRMEVGKIAFRREGKWWVAYHAAFDNRPPVELARVLMHIAENNPKVKEAFLDFGRLIVGGVIKDITGHEAGFDGPQPAPDSERSGHS